MASTFQLEYAGTRRSLKAWGIESLKTEYISLDADTLTFEVPTRDITADPPFAYGAQVDLFRDSVRVFSGIVTQLPAKVSAQRDLDRFVISNAWFDLARTMFQDDRYVHVDPDNSDSALTLVNNTSVVLFQNTVSSSLRTNGAQITRALQFAIAHGVALQIGTIDCAIKVPFEEGTDLTCAEVIRRCCRWQPDTVSWFDYTTNPPTIHFRRRENLAAVSLDLSAGNLVLSAEPSPRYDLQPLGIKIFLERVSIVSGKSSIYFQQQTAGSGGEGPGCIVTTIPVQGTDPEDNYVPRTLAADFFASVSVLQWEGAVELAEAECSGLLRPGNVLNLTGIRSAWATMAAVVQSVTEDIARGRTSVRFGPPTQLSPQDFLQLARTARMTTVNNTGRAASATSGAGVSTSVPVSMGQEVDICSGGVTKKISIPFA